MQILVIPDVHLKPDIFMRAHNILMSGRADMAVCLGDIVDEYDKAEKTLLYYDTFDAFEEFAVKHRPLYCWGDHDRAYFWDRHVPNKATDMDRMICESFEQIIQKTAAEDYAVIHKVDNLLFSHAGLTTDFLSMVLKTKRKNLTAIIKEINKADKKILWNESSPLRAHPLWNGDRMFSAADILQIIGHTPVKKPLMYKNTLTVDVFTKSPSVVMDVWKENAGEAKKTGYEKFIIIDSVTKEWIATAG